MIRNKFIFLSLFLLVLASNYQINCDNEGFFTVVGSNLLKYQQPYRVALTYQGYKDEKILQIGLKEVKGTGYEVYKNVTINGDGIKNVVFDLNNQPKGNYVLEVISMTGKSFNQNTSLHMNLRQYSTFIQTDKSIYKPGDIVKFRIFVVDGDTKPFKFDDIEVFITDGGRNRVKLFEDPKGKFIKGVYQNELQLSDQPVMGTWRINVKVNNGTAKVKNFEVSEYVLPKFELTMDTEPANFKDGKIRATVKATYTFGKFAKGTAQVTAKLERGRYSREDWTYIDESVLVTKQVDVDGKKFVEFDAINELKMNESRYESQVTITASFVEEITQRQVNVTKRISVEKSPFKIKLTKSADKIKPGLPFKVRAQVMYHDKDMPVTDSHKPVKFDISYRYNVMRTCIRQEYPEWFNPHFRFYNRNESVTQRPLTVDDIIKTEYECREVKSIDEEIEVFPENGIAEVILEVKGNTTDVHVGASYLDVSAHLYSIPIATSKSNKFIQLYYSPKWNPSTDKHIFLVTSNTEIDHLNYKIIGSSGYIETRSIKFEKNFEKFIEIIPSPSMGSSIKLIVFYITEDGELISDKTSVDLDGNLGNYVNLNLSSDQLQPGQNITITVDSTPNSFIGLLGVDQSVLLLKSGNDIDENVVNNELRLFEQYDVYSYGRFDSSDRERFEDFNDKVVIISNAKGTPARKYIPTYNNQPYDLPLDGYNRFGDSDWNDSEPDFDSDIRMSPMNPPRADSPIYASPGVPGPKPIQIRKEFPETWLFEDFDLGDNTKHVLSKKVPDTITSWIITGFSLNADYGLGITKESTKLNVFQPFFVSTNLPYSIKRGEIVSIPFAVFNYLGTDQNVVVKFFNSDREFEFVDVDVNRREKRALVKERMKEILVKSNEGSSISFMIRPLKVGQITIKVTAESQQAGDGIERQLKVEPEGVPQYFNEAVFVDLRNQKNFQKNIQISVPVDAVDDSIKIEASVIGDILGPTLENLDNLIQLPYGCAEQNMLKFVPNILVLEYLTILNKLTPEMEVKVKKHLDVGYQKQLTYKNTGGSYSGFGMKSEKGSTWLTAYVAKSFNQASKYIEIDQQVIIEALDFLTSVQAQNGSFPEYGHVSYTPMQGGASKGIGLTAYTLITFLENKQHNEKYKEVIKHALDYIVTNVKELDDIYVLAIASYALQLAGHEMKDELLVKLNVKAQEMDGMKYWKKEIVDDEGRMYRHRSILNVEITSYAMLAFIIAGHDQQLIPIMKWLVSQRNHRGGFQSTQDTVVGLQALSQLASIIPFSNNQMTITVKPEYSAQKSFDLNSKNSLNLQK
ncbi:CD109 antigen-like [Chironomus tepperi]|uniref:CD109 antigen-like n=1 Tax=Chironomus tepperi TaxID=113505 RepID=UPI00391F4396